jgi:hypothetical protein
MAFLKMVRWFGSGFGSSQSAVAASPLRSAGAQSINGFGSVSILRFSTSFDGDATLYR